jgi:hypothetical protein
MGEQPQLRAPPPPSLPGHTQVPAAEWDALCNMEAGYNVIQVPVTPYTIMAGGPQDLPRMTAHAFLMPATHVRASWTHPCPATRTLLPAAARQLHALRPPPSPPPAPPPSITDVLLGTCPQVLQMQSPLPPPPPRPADSRGQAAHRALH